MAYQTPDRELNKDFINHVFICLCDVLSCSLVTELLNERFQPGSSLISESDLNRISNQPDEKPRKSFALGLGPCVLFSDV